MSVCECMFQREGERMYVFVCVNLYEQAEGGLLMVEVTQDLESEHEGVC